MGIISDPEGSVSECVKAYAYVTGDGVSSDGNMGAGELTIYHM